MRKNIALNLDHKLIKTQKNNPKNEKNTRITLQDVKNTSKIYKT